MFMDLAKIQTGYFFTKKWYWNTIRSQKGLDGSEPGQGLVWFLGSGALLKIADERSDVRLIRTVPWSNFPTFALPRKAIRHDELEFSMTEIPPNFVGCPVRVVIKHGFRARYSKVPVATAQCQTGECDFFRANCRDREERIMHLKDRGYRNNKSASIPPIKRMRLAWTRVRLAKIFFLAHVRYHARSVRCNYGAVFVPYMLKFETRCLISVNACCIMMKRREI